MIVILLVIGRKRSDQIVFKSTSSSIDYWQGWIWLPWQPIIDFVLVILSLSFFESEFGENTEFFKNTSKNQVTWRKFSFTQQFAL